MCCVMNEPMIIVGAAYSRLGEFDAITLILFCCWSALLIIFLASVASRSRRDRASCLNMMISDVIRIRGNVRTVPRCK